ncbi:MAG: DUF2809 domain-containing protein [Chitinophagaceae bacterium]
MFRFHWKYFILFIIIFCIEILIAAYVNDQVIRPYIGDFLVVIMLYCFVRAFVNVSPVKAAIAVLLFSYAIEISQYYRLVYRLGLGHSKIAVIVMGSSFEWIDLVAYTAGIAVVLFAEMIIRRRHAE